MEFMQSPEMHFLINVLSNTFNSDSIIRKDAEQKVDEFLHSQNSLVILILFVNTPSTDKSLRQAAAIILKNNIRHYWSNNEEDKERLPSTLENRTLFKTHLLNGLLVVTDTSIRGLLVEVVRIIAEGEFPSQWPELLPELLRNIQSDNVLSVYNSIYALRKIIKRYEYKLKEKRKDLNEIIRVSFPIIERLLSNLKDFNTVEAAMVMKCALKIFSSCTCYCLPDLNQVNLQIWFESIKHLLAKPFPEPGQPGEPSGQPADTEGREAWPWWKLKKWCARIVYQFISRYGNPMHCGEENRPFAEFFRSELSILLLTPVMNVLEIKAKGGFITSRVHQLCLGYVAHAIEMSPTYKLIKQHMSMLLFDMVLPTLALSNEDIYIFNSDPSEFIRKLNDPLEEWVEPRTAAVSLLQALARYRQKDTLPILLPKLQSIMDTFNDTPIDQRDYRQMDGVLVAVATMAKIMHESKQYKASLEPFVKNQLFPIFQSPAGFLRCRACWVVGYLDFDWSNKEILSGLLQGLLSGLRDHCLPVKASAADSMRVLVNSEDAKPLILPILTELVSEYFKIMSEVESESVVAGLFALVENFHEELVPLSGPMIEKLIEAFKSYATTAAEDEDDDAAFSATQTLDTISVIAQSAENHPQILQNITPLLTNLVGTILVEEKEEYIDSAVEIISYMTYYTDGIIDGWWNLCGPLLHLMKFRVEVDYDYIDEITVPVLSYICKGIDQFVIGNYNGISFVDYLCYMSQIALKKEATEYSNEETEGTAALTVILALLTSSQSLQNSSHSNSNNVLSDGAIVVSIMNMVIEKLIGDDTTRLQPIPINWPDCSDMKNGKLPSGCATLRLRVKCIECICACIYHSPDATMVSLCSSPVEFQERLFEMLFIQIKELQLETTQRLVVVAFSTMLAMDNRKLPQVVQRNSSGLLQTIVKELILIRDGTGSGEGGEGGDTNDDIEDEDEDFDMEDDDEVEGDDNDGLISTEYNKYSELDVPEGGYGEDEDCVDAEDESYRQYLEQIEAEGGVKTYRGGALIGEGDGEEDDGSGTVDFTSQVDKLDIFDYFVRKMKDINNKNASFYQSLQSSLQGDDIINMQALMLNRN